MNKHTQEHIHKDCRGRNVPVRALALAGRTLIPWSSIARLNADLMEVKKSDARGEGIGKSLTRLRRTVVIALICAYYVAIFGLLAPQWALWRLIPLTEAAHVVMAAVLPTCLSLVAVRDLVVAGVAGICSGNWREVWHARLLREMDRTIAAPFIICGGLQPIFVAEAASHGNATSAWAQWFVYGFFGRTEVPILCVLGGAMTLWVWARLRTLVLTRHSGAYYAGGLVLAAGTSACIYLAGMMADITTEVLEGV